MPWDGRESGRFHSKSSHYDQRSVEVSYNRQDSVRSATRILLRLLLKMIKKIFEKKFLKIIIKI